MVPVFMFPGQSSKHPEMLERIIAVSPALTEPIIELASSVLGRDLRGCYASENPFSFASNRDVQVGVFLVNHLHLVVLQDAVDDAPFSLGLSLGEYNHLVHIGALSFEEGLRLVNARGAAYDAGPDGVMAAIFPIDLDALEEVLVRARAHGFIDVANLNSPTQHVVAGERAAVEAALSLLEDEHLVQGRIIERRIPMHTARFAPVAARLRPALERAKWRRPVRPYFPNVCGELFEHPSTGELVALLSEHVHRPVLWRKSIELVTTRWPDAVFVEVGPRTVLTDLLQRSWCKNARFATDGAAGVHGLPESFFKRAARGS
jgi:[acyl-carrier-protein] S-malonyltransferase